MADQPNTLTELRRLRDKATPAPWKRDDVYMVGPVKGGRPGGEVLGDCNPSVRRLFTRDDMLANAALIVALRNNADFLLEGIAVLEQIAAHDEDAAGEHARAFLARLENPHG